MGVALVSCVELDLLRLSRYLGPFPITGVSSAFLPSRSEGLGGYYGPSDFQPASAGAHLAGPRRYRLQAVALRDVI